MSPAEFRQIALLSVLVDIVEGRQPNLPRGTPAYNYDRSEIPLWSTGAILQGHVESRGYSTCVSMRVLPGVWSRVGMYHPPQQSTQLADISQGILVITNEALWFDDGQSITKTTLSTLARVDATQEGLRFIQFGHGEHAFVTGANEGWFYSALLARLHKQNR